MATATATAAAARLSHLVDLDTDASIIEAAAKRVRRAFMHGSLATIGWVTCVYINRTHTLGNKIRTNLSNLDIRTAEDRALLKDIAQNLSQAAIAFEGAYNESERSRLVKLPVFGPKLMASLEDLVCTFEDISETAALGASQAFAASVRDELRKNLKDAALEHATA